MKKSSPFVKIKIAITFDVASKVAYDKSRSQNSEARNYFGQESEFKGQTGVRQITFTNVKPEMEV
ncbi:hypothetical protein DCC39_12920 [Pueribacillus theae]|uniref:Uncharacterized protein n=1 Tax=Pueribacillus theae TaxID=2171751 RepID=A0A2U1JXC8_9BACI|nr:hypothetical protein [Pueribacillus theae]PWA09473.1 hypothetical protein DCC39_12920 [Pueribacillus theae]